MTFLTTVMAFFWVFSMAWVSNRWHGFLISGLGLLIGGLGGGCGGRCWLQLVWWFVCVWFCWWFDGSCFCVCVVIGLDRLIGVSWVSVCVWLCWWLCWWFDGLCLCGSVCVVMGLDRLIDVSWVCVCGSVCWIGVRGLGRLRKKNTVGKPRKIDSCQNLKKSDDWKEIITKD